MNISEESLKYLSNLIIGDIGGVYKYKTGSEIIRFFKRYFGIECNFSQRPSRWIIAYNALVEIWNRNKFNEFLSTILSVSYLKFEYPANSPEELSSIISEVLNLINVEFEKDKNTVVKTTSGFVIIKINDDEVVLGKGGFATCYYIKSKQIVEKRLNESEYSNKGLVSRFKREYEITKSLSNLEGIINVFDYYPDRLAYTMEKGECDLARFVDNNALNDETKRRIIYQIATIMSSVHERDIVHRDLSPTNIFVISGMLKIADFGLGKNLSIIHSHETINTKAYGQFHYCDPRQYEKLKLGDKQSDIYSIGKIINFVYTKNPNKYVHRYRIVATKATEENISLRYKSVNDLIDGLKQIDSHVENEEFYERFSKKIQNRTKLDSDDALYVCSFDSNKLYNMIESSKFREAFIKMREDNLIDEKMFKSKVKLLVDYPEEHKISKWDDCDRFGYLGVLILTAQSKTITYVEKELGIDLINISISRNRYQIMDIVKKYICNNIDPTLEDKIDSNIKSWPY